MRHPQVPAPGYGDRVRAGSRPRLPTLPGHRPRRRSRDRPPVQSRPRMRTAPVRTTRSGRHGPDDTGPDDTRSDHAEPAAGRGGRRTGPGRCSRPDTWLARPRAGPATRGRRRPRRSGRGFRRACFRARACRGGHGPGPAHVDHLPPGREDPPPGSPRPQRAAAGQRGACRGSSESAAGESGGRKPEPPARIAAGIRAVRPPGIRRPGSRRMVSPPPAVRRPEDLPLRSPGSLPPLNLRPGRGASR